MSNSIVVKDLARGQISELAPKEPILRVPYDLWNPLGAVRRKGPIVEWSQQDGAHHGKTALSTLGEARPGERVLVQLPPGHAEDEWWLCEVMAVGGVAADL